MDAATLLASADWTTLNAEWLLAQVTPGFAPGVTPGWWLKTPAIVFAFCFGACVGSFLNVVIYRLPAGISIISPPSRCPVCGARLSWRENFPILGWLMLRGHCKSCDVKISPQYVILELFVALMFVALTIVFFLVNPSTPYWGDIASGWWWWNGIRALPGFIAVLIMFSGLIAMTVIDARTFTIPLSIPFWVTIVAFVAWPVQALIRVSNWRGQTWPIPELNWVWFWVSMGGLLGILISLTLLKIGVLKYSFADYEDYLPTADESHSHVHGEEENLWQKNPLIDFLQRILFYMSPGVGGLVTWRITNDLETTLMVVIGGFVISVAVALVLRLRKSRGDSKPKQHQPPPPEHLAPDYPHARREMLLEIVFLLPCMVLMVAGFLVGRAFTGSPGAPPLILIALGSCAMGYLVAGGLVWGIRILGSLGFGREAMGMGDVHLLAAVGAAIGWVDPIFIFFGAAFVGLAWVLPALFIRGLRREMPYGPHLAAATVLVLLLHPILYHGPNYWGQIVTAMQMAFP